MSRGRPHLLLSAIDTEDEIYFHWLDLDDPTVGKPYLVLKTDVAAALAELSAALPSETNNPLSGATNMWSDPRTADRVLRPLAREFLPADLITHIQYATPPGHRADLAVSPSLCWAQIPWELLPIDLGDGRFIHLMDIADVRGAVTSPGRQDCERSPQPGTGRPLYVIDPVPYSPKALLTATDPAVGRAVDRWKEHVADQGQVLGLGNVNSRSVTSTDLSAALNARQMPSRFMYFGHCEPPDPPDAPVTAGLLLFDEEETTVRSQPLPPIRVGNRRLHRLSALDLRTGTPPHTASDGTEMPAIPGVEAWPMPPRVALIACGSGAETGHYEALGLVAACVNAGAEYVTATRWTIPADLPTNGGTTELAVAVDVAHQSTDPIAELNQWQRRKFESWRANPTDVSNSPLLWASVMTFWAPA